MAYYDAIVYVGQLGASTYEQSLNGVLYTEGQIGIMADRILWTESQIGVMADRIVYVTEFSQDNTLLFTYQIISLMYMGRDSMGYKYAVTVMPVPSMPWPT